MLSKNLNYPRTGSHGDLKKGYHAPLHCWDILSMHLGELAREGKRQVEYTILSHYKQQYRWVFDLEHALKTSYDALVLTDADVAIQWVNTGFTQMTGYGKQEVVGRSPKMLQGPNTKEDARRRVRQKLYDQESFTEDLVNYRKTGEEYLCRVEIHPIFDESNRLSHYLALEQELK
ncbi:MAG: PAS domain-containing protein [Bacteroidota bacterium]